MAAQYDKYGLPKRYEPAKPKGESPFDDLGRLYQRVSEGARKKVEASAARRGVAPPPLPAPPKSTPAAPPKSTPAAPPKSTPPPSEGRYHTRGINSPYYDPASDLTGRTASSQPAGLPKSARGKPGYDATAKAPPKNKPSRPASGRPASLPSSRKSPEAAAKQVVANAPAAKPTPAPAVKKSWWDKFSDDHKLSADKSYADYKKLMESM